MVRISAPGLDVLSSRTAAASPVATVRHNLCSSPNSVA
eukprot:CAMPEP_0181373926 /NCGR_PEP_ID=MMETSP1106-20121128/15686_1 /TAXON_ID=81844 /ORGANISM="Mantoniella antarctica, Strain SL-175" /LENGTH=37 /DNA_ID= /DNA_START= /DNA_END= /DNA_ORIENTATION=